MNREKLLRFLWNWGPVALAIASALAGIFLALDLFIRGRPRLLPYETEMVRQIVTLREQAAAAEATSKQLREQVVQNEERVRELVQTISEKGSGPVQGGTDIRPLQIMVKDVANQIMEVGKQSKAVEVRMGKIEGVILADALKAIELPLMKRDLQSLQSQLERDLKTVREENGRVYDVMKWIIGLMGLISFSLIGIAVGNIFRGRAA